MNKDKFERKTTDVMQSTLVSIAQGLTGIATSEKKEFIISISHILQKLRGGNFLSRLKKEWDYYCEKGKIKEDYQFSEQHNICFHELLDFLDKDIPDQTRFDVLKQIFLVAASEKKSDRDSVLPHQYMKICRSLSTGEIFVLNTTYQIVKRKDFTSDEHYSAQRWLEKIAKESGLKHVALVDLHERELIKKKLITPRKYPDESGIYPKPYFRLSDLGYDICEYIDNYEK